MPNRLTEAQWRHYHTDGITFPIPILSPAEVRSYRGACDKLESQLGGKPRTVEVRQMHLHFLWAYELASHPRVLDAVENLLGPDLLIWATELFTKHPHDATVSINWHRDRPYMGFASGLTTTAWIALGDSTPANGCMRAVPRSAESPAAGRAATARPERLTGPADERDLLEVVLQAGEMSLHDADVLHGSGPNRSIEKRVGFAVRFITPETYPLSGRPRVLLARGRDRHGRFELVEPPVAVEEEQALTGMRQSAMQHLDAVLQNLKDAQRQSCVPRRHSD
jgi:ectoine hydroxylase-related dioxygenase (phytanoyl-CoA dioxygenase family)